MFAIIGLLTLFGCVFGGYVIAGGSMAPILKAAPIEMVIIGGAGAGALLIGNSKSTIKSLVNGIKRIFKGSRYHKDDYLSTIFLVAKILKVLKTSGGVEVETHIENPQSSAIFGEYPALLNDHTLLSYITDNMRLMVTSANNLSPYAVEEVMDSAIKTHHHDELKPVDALSTMAGALPALGIVACVLGVVKTMSQIDSPPPVLGGLVGSALVGTFLGVFLAYGIVEPMAIRLKQIVEEEAEIYHVVKQLIVGTLHGHPLPLVIEAARVAISHEHQPSFSEVFDGMRGK